MSKGTRGCGSVRRNSLKALATALISSHCGSLRSTLFDWTGRQTPVGAAGSSAYRDVRYASLSASTVDCMPPTRNIPSSDRPSVQP